MASSQIAPANSNLFRAYIGAMFNNAKFTDIPINPNVEFHFLLSFAIDYDNSGSSPTPTNGKFKVYWDSDNLSPSKVSSIKNQHSNVKVGLSIGGDTVESAHVYFNPSSIDSWVSNAVSSLTRIIQQYNLDGIDINYEHFHSGSDPKTFSECIGKLIKILKSNGVISFASIAPFESDQVQSHYLALWKSCGNLIDYVNFQFYAYDRSTTVSQFMDYFKTQCSNYRGGKVLVSFNSDGSGGLSPENGFFEAYRRLKSEGQLGGIFVWCADVSKKKGFQYEDKSQDLLASIQAAPANTGLFRAYIGATFNEVKFTDVPINRNIEFHFLLSFAIDYVTSGSSPTPTNGKFSVFWDSDNLSPSEVSSIKNKHSNVKVGLSLGGDTVGSDHAYFNPSSIDSWLSNAISSLTTIIQQYNLDGIDICYEHFNADPNTFSECIGRLIKSLKSNGVISFASIAPFDNEQGQRCYLALWKSYGNLIDYVNFQFHSYDQGTTESQFIEYFKTQSSNYKGGKVLASFESDGSGGLSMENGFYTACERIKSEGKLGGISVWCADDSKEMGFPYEAQLQDLLTRTI